MSIKKHGICLIILPHLDLHILQKIGFEADQMAVKSCRKP